MTRPARPTRRILLAAAAAPCVRAASVRGGAPADAPLVVRIMDLNSGKVVFVGRLDCPLGTYHVVRATFGVPNAKGRAHNGGRLHMQVYEIDGRKLAEPVWLPYFKGMTLQTYRLKDGTDIFPDYRDVQSLQGKTIVCKVYETVDLLDAGGDVSEHYGNTDKKGFDLLHYQTSLGVLRVIE